MILCDTEATLNELIQALLQTEKSDAGDESMIDESSQTPARALVQCNFQSLSSTGSLTSTSPAWETDETGPFVEVWKKWCNKKDKEKELIAGNVIELDSLFATTAIERTSGKLYIREHYIQVYQRLCERAVDPVCGGVVLSGQPGTGKTYCLFFLLLKKLVKGEPVLFSRHRSEVLYFSAGGVQLNENIASSHLRQLYPKVRNTSAKTWALLNGGPRIETCRSGRPPND